MAEKTQEQPEKERPQEEEHETLVRILGFDIPGSRNIYAGLTRIKGVSWTLANATCVSLNFEKTKQLSDLTKPEVEKIESFLKDLKLPDFLKNRRFDMETGETTHYIGTDLDMKKEFDIKRLKKIKSYKGLRHSQKLPVRGQRTRSNFRERGKAVGVTKKSK